MMEATDARLDGQLVRVADLSHDQRHAMYELMLRYYDGVTRIRFERDLDEKQWAILATDPIDQCILGFSTQMVLTVSHRANEVAVLFSGDTIIDSRYWARNPLATIWGRMVLALIDRHGSQSLYWFLTSKGYKTYRFLPVFFHEFFPRFDKPTDEWACDLIATVSRSRYGMRFDEARGVVSTNGASDRLKPDVASISRRRLNDPHTRFFVERNPGHVSGEELCCIAPLTRQNFRKAAYHVIGEGYSIEL